MKRYAVLLLPVAVALFDSPQAFACSCPGYAGLLETGPMAVHVIEARVLSHHPAPGREWAESMAESIVVRVMRSHRGSLSGDVRLYGSGGGDCTVSATGFAVGDTFLFLLPAGFGNPLPEKPGYGLYGVCGAVSGNVRDGVLEGVFESSKRGEERRTTTMPVTEYIRAIGGAGTRKNDRP
jgi:hypothetical protein